MFISKMFRENLPNLFWLENFIEEKDFHYLHNEDYETILNTSYVHADVALVNASDELNFLAFEKWRPEYNDSYFITDEDGTFKAKYDEPAIGRSLIMSPFNQFFTWQTTTITEIVEQREDYIKFKTENSNYELWKLKQK
jgi:hypothetical protein